MKLVPVKSIPKRSYHPLQDMIEEFARSDNKIVRIDFTEHDYKSSKVCYSCIWNGVKRSGHMIKVTRRGEDVFMSKI